MFWTRVNMPIASPVKKINSGDMSNDTNQGKYCYTNVTNKNPKSQWPNKDFTSHSYTSDVGWGTLQDRLLSLSLPLTLKKQLAHCHCTGQDLVPTQDHLTPNSYKSPQECLKIL